MKYVILYIILTLQILLPDHGYSQPDQEPPHPPVLNLVTVNQITGNSELYWSLSPSPDVSGYVVYSYLNGEGYALDTLHDPYITSYIRHGSGSSYLSESFVIAAIDSSDNISPLSNELHTIFTNVGIDTCNKRIEITWNSYSSYPKPVINYTVLVSENPGSFTEVGKVFSDKKSFIISDFATDSQYCFIVRANLEGGFVSVSNKKCVITTMQRPPKWINADYATVNAENKISLSFTVDPLSEITHFALERKSGTSDTYQKISEPISGNGSVLFTDNQANINSINYYRLSAINNCNNTVTISNICSNMVLLLERKDNDLNFSWNSYKEWLGTVSSYRLFMNTGKGFEEKKIIQPTDTTFTLDYKEIMYDVSEGEICFYLSASEESNPYGIAGESLSSKVSMVPTEIIIVPNVFTPDNDMVNDLFRPVLSFTPLDYHLIICDRRNNILFETRDYHAEWDGSRNGDTKSQVVCLWFLKVTAPSGKTIIKTGTVTIINRHD